jgi:hypothetical protein
MEGARGDVATCETHSLPTIGRVDLAIHRRVRVRTADR